MFPINSSWPRQTLLTFCLLAPAALTAGAAAQAGSRAEAPGRPDGAALQQAAAAAMRAALTAASLRADVEAVGPPPELSLPPGAVRWRVRAVDAGTPAPRMAAWVDIEVAGHPPRSVRIALQVHAWRKAWVATADVPAGAILAPSMVALVEFDVAAARGALREEEFPATVTRLRHALLSGRPLTVAMLEAVPAVTRGDWVHLRLQDGAVSVEQRVEALQDGRPGQRVLVRAAQGAIAQMAVVAGPGQVEIVEQKKSW